MLLSPPRSPYDHGDAATASPFSFVETVETSPVEEPRGPDTEPNLPHVAEAPFTGTGCVPVTQPWDVRLLPPLFAVTFWCGLAVLYAFFAYTIGLSADWRGPLIIWGLLIPTVVFSLWRHLPAERARLAKLTEETLLLRCGGYYDLAEPQTASASSPSSPPPPAATAAAAAEVEGVEEMEMTAMRSSRRRASHSPHSPQLPRSTSSSHALYATVA